MDILGVPRKTMNQILAGKKPTYGVEGSEPNGRDIAKEPEPDDYPELLATNQLIKAGKMDAIKRVLTIISGNSSIQLYLDFLHRFNHSDIQVSHWDLTSKKFCLLQITFFKSLLSIL